MVYLHLLLALTWCLRARSFIWKAYVDFFFNAGTPGSLGDRLLQILILAKTFLEQSSAARYKVLYAPYPNEGMHWGTGIWTGRGRDQRCQKYIWELANDKSDFFQISWKGMHFQMEHHHLEKIKVDPYSHPYPQINSKCIKYLKF